MTARLAYLVFLIINTTGCAATPTRSAASESKTVQNFVYFGRDRERIVEENFVSTQKFIGAQLMYAWKELEHGENEYDFSEIQKDLDFLNSKGKKLFIQLQDTTFDPTKNAVPNYLTTNKDYKGGITKQYDDKGNIEGWVLKRWVPTVAGRLYKLLRELGKTFDGKIEGIALQETAVGICEKSIVPKQCLHPEKGFTYVGYRDSILSNMEYLKIAFPKSVSMQYANFMPGEFLPKENNFYLSSVFEFGKKNGIAIGAPDLMPKSLNQQVHAFKFMNALGDRMLIGVAVQDGNYSGTTNVIMNPTEPWPNIVPELDTYARDFLKVNYIFWGAEEPYFTHDVVPYFKRNGA